MQSDPVTQELRLETARKQVEYREKAVAAREQAEQEIATIRESAAAKKVQLLEPREEPRKSEEPREIEAPPKIEGPSFFVKPTASAPTPEPALTPPPVPTPVPTSAPAPATAPTPATAPALTPLVPTTMPRPIVPQAKCAYCRSLRTIQCQACINTGGFSTGLMICPECRTARTVICPKCHGNWQVSCSTCKGQGKIAEQRYVASYWDPAQYRTIPGRYYTVYHTCGNCDGTGRVTGCHSCTKGRTSCSTCKGAGRVGVCPKCNGEKRVPCPMCQTAVKK